MNLCWVKRICEQPLQSIACLKLASKQVSVGLVHQQSGLIVGDDKEVAWLALLLCVMVQQPSTNQEIEVKKSLVQFYIDLQLGAPWLNWLKIMHLVPLSHGLLSNLTDITLNIQDSSPPVVQTRIMGWVSWA